MAYILISFFNLIIGLLSLFPSHTIDVDLTPLTDFLPFLNYFIPFYLISPIILTWMGLLIGMAAVLIGKGFIVRHF